ncbi:MAG: membrane protein insertion efficiency factor YidD [Acidobacteriota bacterium]
MRRRRIAAAAAVLALLAAIDLSRAPNRQWSAPLLLGAIDLYQDHLSGPLASLSGSSCRFEVSCSHYAEAVIASHGSLEGSRLTLLRILRCGPWTEPGTADPPPRPVEAEP